MQSVVRVLKGSYRGDTIRNKTFTLVKGLQSGKKGNYITVRNDGKFPEYAAIDLVKIKVDGRDDFEFVSGSDDSQPVIQVVTKNETDEQVMERIRTRFAILDEMTKASALGNIRGLIVTGPPGVGKSHGVTTQLHKASMFDTVAGRKNRFETVKGTMSAIGMFSLMYRYRDAKNVLVFDDCDIWEDKDAINILKGALDSGKSRRISYNKDSRLLREEDIPNSFDFLGSIIFITNTSFDEKRASKIQPHLEALQSRSHFLDLTIDTDRDKMLRIKQVHQDTDGGLFRDYYFKNNEDQEILDYMWTNRNRLREMSMRMAVKIADLTKVSETNWRMYADNTCLKRD